jgi:pimeloyl-ACP methyl ester carboxylesterase
VNAIAADLPFALHASATARGGPCLVAVHGISRNDDEILEHFAPIADRYGAVLVVPRFGAERFPDYQRLGRHGPEADRALLRLLDRLEAGGVIGPGRVRLFGHSGGAQFVHRFVMAHPERVARYVASAAGWYTLPDPSLAFPDGIGRCAQRPDLAFHPDAFLAVPGHVLVGMRDVSAGPSLRRSGTLDAAQGGTRLERARHFVAVMSRAAEARGLAPPLRLSTIADAAHRFRRLAHRSGIVALTGAALFEPQG